MIPKNIEESHVLLALKDIDKKGIEVALTKSRRYNLVYQNKKYPPKLVISKANEFANGRYLSHREFNTYQAQKYLKALNENFIIIEIENDMIENLIKKYKTHLGNNGLVDELYKWELLNQYKGRPDLNAIDFQAEIKSVDYKNLIYPVARTVIFKIADERASDYKECFEMLFNEEIPLYERVKRFGERVSGIYRTIESDAKLSHHHDERTISTFLTFHYPEKYTFYKDSFYQKYCKLRNIQPKEKGHKFVHYLELIEDFVEEYIVNDPELLDLVQKGLPTGTFEDKNHLLLAQDILYQTLDKLALDEKVVALIAADRTAWQDEVIEEFQGHEYCILWNSKRPSGTEETLAFLSQIVEEENTFYLYYSSGGNVNHRATIIDFVEDQNELSTANWKGKYSDVLYYHDDFNLYNDGKKNATIVFLASNIEKIKPIPITDFKVFKSWEYPRQDNLTPIKKEPSVIEVISFRNTKEPSREMKDESKRLNQILFGPPGTGKTYNTINKAIQTINPKFDTNQDRKIVKEEYDRLLKNGQITFITFHQSMSYEDFIEGIKPLKPLVDDKFVRYEVQDGLFKKICNDSKSNFENAKIENKSKLAFELAFEKLKDEWDLNRDIKFPLKTEGYDFTIMGFTNTSIQFKKASGGTSHTLSINTLRDLYYGREINFSQGVGIYYPSILNKLKSYSTENLTNTASENFVLIIDEINRGNVSQIFGELITLIEEDKRLGKGEALEVTLPYSKDKFSVPPNLFIIGTMNTADRSVEALDAALRRRFSFQEMPPRYDLKELDYEVGGVKISDLLRTINLRIEKLLDKDHKIGHSYFILDTNEKPEDRLIAAFYKNIIPLLQEYFFGDYGKIGLVLGKGFVRKKMWAKNSESFADFDSESATDYDDREVFEILDYSKNENISITMGNSETEFDFEKAIQLLMNQKSAKS